MISGLVALRRFRSRRERSRSPPASLGGECALESIAVRRTFLLSGVAVEIGASDAKRHAAVCPLRRSCGTLSCTACTLLLPGLSAAAGNFGSCQSATAYPVSGYRDILLLPHGGRRRLCRLRIRASEKVIVPTFSPAIFNTLISGISYILLPVTL